MQWTYTRGFHLTLQSDYFSVPAGNHLHKNTRDCLDTWLFSTDFSLHLDFLTPDGLCGSVGSAKVMTNWSTGLGGAPVAQKGGIAAFQFS